MPRRNLDILIVGGGIGGLTAALSLKQAGHRVTVLERRPELAEVNTGFLLWAFAIRRLRDLGLGPAIGSIGQPVMRLVTRSWRGHILSDLDLRASNARVGTPSYDVHRARLQRLLAEAVGIDRIHLGTACKRVFLNARGATAETEEGARIDADLLLGADGVHSTVRTLLFGRVPIRRENIGVWRGVANVDTELLPEGAHIRLMGPGGLFGVGRLSETEVRWYAGAPLPLRPAPPGEGRRAEVTERFAGWAEPVPQVLAATEEDAVLFNDAPYAEPFSPWSRGRVGLLGDAVHPTMPTLAYGGAMAIEDGAVLTQALESARAPSEALSTFEGVRRKPAADIQRRSLLFERMISWRRPSAVRLREAAFSPPLDAVQRIAVSRLMRGGT